jgi:tripartite-type tricarboxylate transporter receptor subunit TctC
MMRNMLAAVLTLGALATSAVAQEKNYPTRPITIIVPWGAGNGTDIVTRRVAELLAPRVGQAVVVQNVAGAGGTIGSTQMHRSAPDGYTIMMVSNADHGAAPSIFKDLQYDPLKEEPISRVVALPNAIVVGQANSIDSMKTLIARAKASPGKLNYASTGIGTSSHLVAELFKKQSGIDIVMVQYKTTGPAVMDIIANRIDLMFFNVQAAIPQIKGGSLRALAVTGAERSSGLPDVPTMSELGYPSLPTSWMGLVAPPKTPKEIIDRLSREVREILKDPKFVEASRQEGTVVFQDDTPAKFKAFMRDEIEMWREVVKFAGAKAE